MFESEERQIAERIKDYIKKERPIADPYIMLRDGRILHIHDYRPIVSRGKINPQDAYVYIKIDWPSLSSFHYPFLDIRTDLSNVYLSKLGFIAKYFAIAPATGLKYVTTAFIIYEKDLADKYLSMEVVNLDTIVNNTNIPKIIVEVLGDKVISGEKKITIKEHEKIEKMFRSQKLFAGYNFDEARDIIIEYYDKGNQSLAKEVARIAVDYYRIFQPYRVCYVYDMEKWKEVDCWSIKLD